MDLGYSIGTRSFPENSFPDVLKHPNSGACQSKKILNPKKQRFTLAKGNVDPKFQEKIPAGTLQSSTVEPPILAAKHLLFFLLVTSCYISIQCLHHFSWLNPFVLKLHEITVNSLISPFLLVKNTNPPTHPKRSKDNHQTFSQKNTYNFYQQHVVSRCFIPNIQTIPGF